MTDSDPLAEAALVASTGAVQEQPGILRVVPEDQDDTLGVEVLVDGQPVPATPACSHREEQLTVQARVSKVDDERWQVKVQVLCECGSFFEIEPTGRRPRDGGYGVVHDMAPSREL